VARARRGDPVDGVLLLDKPSGITSNLALQKARRLLNAAKAGHTGTLDPLASGLLPLTFGEAAKFSADLLEADKTYVATVQLGVRTSTGDAEGDVLETRAVSVTEADVAAVLSPLRGTIEQMPPMHSALKRDGRALYEYARQGIEVERAARTVTIHRLVLLSLAGTVLRLEVECSKGTYVRVLAEDIGAALGCGAHLSALRRTHVGALDVRHATTLEQLTALPAEQRRAALLPVDALVASLPRVELDAALAARFGQGQRLALGTGNGQAPAEAADSAAARPINGRVRVYGPDRRLLGVAHLNEYGVLAPQRLLAQANAPIDQEPTHGKSS
jgi:tRNA pseudouridine55 synthase